jgi:hypothetical protein
MSAPYFTDATGPVDFYDPTDPVVLELLAADGITLDGGGRAHSTSDGRFVSRAVEYTALVDRGPRVRPGQYGDQTWQVTGYKPTWDEVAGWELGPDTWQSYPTVSVFDWPTPPGVTPVIGKPAQWADEPGVSVSVVSACCPDCVHGPVQAVPRRRTPQPVDDRGGFAAYERRYRR